jgi:hypothetical protein
MTYDVDLFTHVQSVNDCLELWRPPLLARQRRAGFRRLFSTAPC